MVTSSRLVLVITFILLVVVETTGQRGNPIRPQTDLDVVFSIAFSPDGSTLAIARGAVDPRQRFGRIELWDTASGKLRHVIKGFDGPVKSISFSPDGQTLLSGSLEYHSQKIQETALSPGGVVFAELKWWDPHTGELQQQRTMSGDGTDTLAATYSPDGKQLAVGESSRHSSYIDMSWPGSPDPTGFNTPTRGGFRTLMSFSADLKLLDAKTGAQRFKLKINRIDYTTFSPDGALLAVASGNEVKLWDCQTGKETHKLKGFRGRPNAIAFSPDGRVLAVVSTRYSHEDAGRFIKVIGKSELRLFDIPTWKLISKLPDVGAANTLAFDPGGKILLIGGVIAKKDADIAGITLLNLRSGSTSNFPTGEDFSQAVHSITISRNGALLAFHSGSGSVQMLDTQDWKVKQTFDASSVGDAAKRPTSRFVATVRRVVAVAFSKDGRTVSSESDNGEIKFWDARTGEVKKHFAQNEDDPSLVAVSRDGKSFAEISNGKLLIANPDNDQKIIVRLPDGPSVSALALSTEARTLAVASGRQVALLKITGEIVKTFTSPRASVSNMIFSDDDRSLVCAGEDGTIMIWDVTTGRIEKTITVGEPITAFRLAPDHQTLAIASEKTITLWGERDGSARQELQKHDAPVNALAFSSDGRLLASGGDDRTVIIWDVASGKLKRRLKGHDQTVTTLAFSPDGTLLASGSGNASVVLWVVGSGKLNRVLR